MPKCQTRFHGFELHFFLLKNSLSQGLTVQIIKKHQSTFTYFSGNPFASDFIEDPGLRKQIFNATMPDEGDGYRLETGISLREYDMCDEKFKTKLATSLAGYKKVSTSIQFTTKFFIFYKV